MRKIFSILVVLMMVAGTFVSCNMPVNDTSAGSANVKDIPNCDLSYLVLTDGNKAICTDKFGDFIKNAPDKQSVLEQCEIGSRDSAPAGWDKHVYDVSESDGRWITDVIWNDKLHTLTINSEDANSRDPIETEGIKIYLPDAHRY